MTQQLTIKVMKTGTSTHAASCHHTCTHMRTPEEHMYMRVVDSGLSKYCSTLNPHTIHECKWVWHGLTSIVTLEFKDPYQMAGNGKHYYEWITGM